MGPILVESCGGKKSMLSCVFMISLNVLAFGLLRISQKFLNCKTLCLQLWREQEHKLFRIKNDHGREFENSFFVELCAPEGIQH